MSQKDFFSSLSKLMSKFLKLTNDEKNKFDSNKESNKIKCIKIYEYVCSLKTNQESEIKFKNNCIIFLKRIIKEKFDINIDDIIIKKNNHKNESNLNYKDNKVKKEIKPKPSAKNENISNINKEIVEPNNSKIYNIILHKNIKKDNKVEEIEKNKISIDNVHSILFQKIKEIANINTKDDIDRIKKKINLIKGDLNNLFLKLKSLNEEIYKEKNNENIFPKYFMLLYSVFPFFSQKQKNVVVQLNLSKGLKKYSVFNRLLINLNEDNEIIENLIYEFFFEYLDNKKKEEKIKLLINNIYKVSPNNTSILYYSYQFLILIIMIYPNNVQLYKRRNILSFLIHFIILNEKHFSFNYDQLSVLYQDLLFIKNFYNNVYNKKIKKPYFIQIQDKKLILEDTKFLENNNFVNISTLFDEKDDKDYDTIMNLNNGIISHFYNINEYNINQLIDCSSYLIKNTKEKFLENIISLINLKSFFITNDFNKYKYNLIKLEKEIYHLANQNLNKNKNDGIINKYAPKNNIKNIFDYFVKKLNKAMELKYHDKYKDKYKFYPMGSLTQFLSISDSDLDLYLYLEDENQNYEIVIAIHDCLSKCLCNFCKIKQTIFSRRLGVIQLELINENISIDLSILGFSPYIHSLLFREYSLLDARFSMVAMAIKHIKNLLNLDKKNYLNSFSWMSLLVIFLQDIINPPILPKLYSNKDINEILKTEIKYGNYKNSNIYNFNNINNTIKNFFKSLKTEIVPLPDCLFDKKKIHQIYQKEIGNNKNKMSCAEILLKFIEFITFYFKYDTIYAENSINGEGFFNMTEIKNIYLDKNKYNDEDISQYNNEFYKYFTKKYLNFKDKSYNKKIRNGFILIRDPVDNHYNPGQLFTNEEYLYRFINKLRSCYSILIKYGSFKKIEEKYKEEIK